jgi:bis(5'-nucleosyl)-tetraphosphatase (symmetrical)
MAVYAVGDIQGCLAELKSVLRKVHFDPQSDELWCVGDLVNRGPESLETLRFLKAMGNACICVLGNHDLHLLGLAALGEEARPSSLDDVLRAPDRDELIDWLRHRPLLHHDAVLGWAMVHAGLHPHWTLEKAKKRAAAVQEKLRGDKWEKFCLRLLKGEFPEREPPRGGKGRARFAAAVLTRSRYCTSDGLFDWQTRVGGPRGQRERPWFAFDRIAWRRDCRIVFGHWAARGLVLDQMHVLGLDSGCVWGGSLTLAELGRRGYFSIVETHACKGYHKPQHRSELASLED